MLLLYIITRLITVWVFFLISLCGVFVFRLAFPAFSSFSFSVVLPLSLSFAQVLSHNTHTQLISHNSSHLTSHTAHLTHLISYNSTHTTHLTQLISHNTTHSRAAFVWLLVELLSCPFIELHPSSLTQLISLLTQLISHNSFISLLTQLISHNSTHSRAAFVLHLVELLSCSSSSSSSSSSSVGCCWRCFCVAGGRV